MNNRFIRKLDILQIAWNLSLIIPPQKPIPAYANAGDNPLNGGAFGLRVFVINTQIFTRRRWVVLVTLR